MKERYFDASCSFIAALFSTYAAWQVFQNRLPEDAVMTNIEPDPVSRSIRFWFKSSAFSETDPDELPPITFKNHYHTLPRTISTKGQTNA